MQYKPPFIHKITFIHDFNHKFTLISKVLSLNMSRFWTRWWIHIFSMILFLNKLEKWLNTFPLPLWESHHKLKNFFAHLAFFFLLYRLFLSCSGFSQALCKKSMSLSAPAGFKKVSGKIWWPEAHQPVCSFFLFHVSLLASLNRRTHLKYLSVSAFWLSLTSLLYPSSVLFGNVSFNIISLAWSISWSSLSQPVVY